VPSDHDEAEQGAGEDPVQHEVARRVLGSGHDSIVGPRPAAVQRRREREAKWLMTRRFAACEAM
jgi:hypothetical protein